MSRGVKRLGAMVVVLAVATALVSGAGATATGRPAPPFTVKSGSGRVLTRAGIKGKVALIYYESRYSHAHNQALKDKIRAWLEGLSPAARQKVAVIQVIDASAANWLTRGVWRRKLREKSRENRWTVYGDWDGRMRTAYKCQKDASNIIVVDRAGLIRMQAVGKLNAQDIARVKQWLTRLMAK